MDLAPTRQSTSASSPAPESRSLIERAYHGALLDTDDGHDTTDGSDTRNRILDAAYEQFCRMGIQRSSMEEVARRARLSRITLYRKFDTKDSLVDEVIVREFRRYFVRFLDEITHADTVAERVVLGFVSSLRAIRTNPLIKALLETEPTIFAGYIGGGDGAMLATVRRFVASQLHHEQRAGTISAELDIELVAEMLVRISASFLTTPSQVVDLDDDDELAAVARQFLVPMVLPASPQPAEATADQQ